MLEAKEQEQRRKCSPKKKVLKFFFQAISKKKGLQKNYSGDLQNFNNSKNTAVLEPKTEQFSRAWGFQAKDLTFEAKSIKMCPRGRQRGLHLWYKPLHKMSTKPISTKKLI